MLGRDGFGVLDRLLVTGSEILKNLVGAAGKFGLFYNLANSRDCGEQLGQWIVFTVSLVAN